MRGFWLLFMFVNLQAASLLSPFSLSYKGVLHAESEQTPGKENDADLPAESNSFATFYNVLTAHYDFSDDFFVTAGGRANLVLGESNYNTPFYLRGKQTSDQLNQAIISEASATYDNRDVSLSVGRMDVSYDWLLGSMDGAIASVGSDDTLSLRVFWLKNFTQLQYNYYFDLKDINEGNGMYGAIVKAREGSFEVTLYDYFMQDLRNIIGGHVSYTDGNFGVNVAYTDAQALSLAVYDYDESFAELSFEWLQGNHFMEIGASLTGENGLLAMVQLGSFMFGQFYLSNQVDRENAQNGFIRYLYGSRKWRFELLGGITAYDNSFEKIENDLSSFELDGYATYVWNRNWSVEVGAMWMNVDERDPIGVDQMLVTGNVVYRYDYF